VSCRVVSCHAAASLRSVLMTTSSWSLRCTTTVRPSMPGSALNPPPAVRGAGTAVLSVTSALRCLTSAVRAKYFSF
jgi:hypothetical protein